MALSGRPGMYLANSAHLVVQLHDLPLFDVKGALLCNKNARQSQSHVVYRKLRAVANEFV